VYWQEQRELGGQRESPASSPSPHTNPYLLHVFSLAWHPDRRDILMCINQITSVSVPGASLPRKHPSPPPFPCSRLGTSSCDKTSEQKSRFRVVGFAIGPDRFAGSDPVESCSYARDGEGWMPTGGIAQKLTFGGQFEFSRAEPHRFGSVLIFDF
jgi:hypothetical protein